MSKPIVHYSGLHYCIEGDSALVKPVDHPSDRVSNKKLVITSPVIRYDPATGEFETLNTIYRPVSALQ